MYDGFCQAAKKKSGRITDGRKAGFHCIYGHMQKRGGAYNPGLQLVFYGIDI